VLDQRSGYRHDAAADLASKFAAAAAAAETTQQQQQQQQQRLLLSYALNRGNPGSYGGAAAAADQPVLLPAFLRPLPARITAEDVQYLAAKGALSLPGAALQGALLQAYVEYVHPYMPLLELHDFLSILDARDGRRGQVSLLLFQAIMFAATAFVDTKALREAGYATRKMARKAFFQKTRVCCPWFFFVFLSLSLSLFGPSAPLVLPPTV